MDIMSKYKLNLNELINVCGGQEYLAIDSLNPSEPLALFIHPHKPKNPIAFNPENIFQIKSIIKGNPSFDGTIEIKDELKTYTWFEICNLHPDIKPEGMYARAILKKASQGQ